MEWLTSKGAVVWVPFTHSSHVDLMAEFDDRLIRVQVKTSTFRSRRKSGEERWHIAQAARPIQLRALHPYRGSARAVKWT
jgi:hypothetical protein